MVTFLGCSFKLSEEYTWDKTACRPYRLFCPKCILHLNLKEREREDPPNRACFEGNLQEVKKDLIMGSWGVLGKGYISP